MIARKPSRRGAPAADNSKELSTAHSLNGAAEAIGSSEHNSATLRHLHAQATQLIMFEARLILDRTTVMLTLNSALLAAVAILNTIAGSSGTLAPILLLSLLGMVLSLSHVLIVSRTRQALLFWRATACLIERQDEFIAPSLRAADLDLTSARVRAWGRNANVRQLQIEAEWSSSTSRLQRIVNKVSLEPMLLYQFVLPALFCCCWVLVSIWAIAHFTATPSMTHHTLHNSISTFFTQTWLRQPSHPTCMKVLT